jgi:hypothetical protein
MSAEAVLSSDLSAEVSNREVAVSAEASARVSGDASLSSDLSAELVARASADTSLAADLSSEIDSLADVDGATISLDAATNTIRLKEAIAAPASGMYTFNSDVEVSGALTVDGVDVMAAISSEISRAESAEDSLEVALSTDVSYLIANTDLTSIDSFAEVSDAVTSVETSVNNLSTNTEDFVYYMEPYMAGFNESPDGTRTQFTTGVGPMIVFLNGLMLTVGEDYGTPAMAPGDTTITIEFLSAPAATDKVNVFGRYLTATFKGIN